ncbi:MAG: hypothetical protein IJ545_00595 [Alphaproteobacteria bacterium]|nr:hypothetical protein [Alphaproteobacteria bacterium]
MRKRISLTALMFFSLFSFVVQAMPKIDAAKIVQKVQEEVGKVQEEAQKIQTQLGNMKQLQQIQGAMEEAKKMKGKIDSAKKTVSDVQKKVGEVQQGVADAQKAVADAQSSATGALGDIQNGLGGAGAQQLLALQTEQAQAQQNLTNDLQALDDEMTAQIKPLEDNRKILEQQLAENPNQKDMIQKKIDDINAQIQKIREEVKAKQEVKQKEFNEAKKALTEKINKLKDLAGTVNLNSMNFGSAQKALSGFFGSGGSAAMSETMQKNFYAADEQDSPQRNGEIDAYRKKVALDDTADVYARAVKMMSYGDKYIIAVKDLEMNAPTADTEPASPQLQISAKIEQMKILLNYAYLSVAELKMTTALDMVTLPKHLNNPEKDPSAFNLDDYRDFKAAAESKKKKGGLLGFVNSVKDKVTELKDKYGDDIKNAIEAGKEAKGLYEDVSAAKEAISSGAVGNGL